MALSWNQVGVLKGPKGDAGQTGPRGEKGGSVRIATVDVTDNSDVAFSALTPSDGVKVGDVIFDAMGQAYAVASVNAGASTAHVGAAVPGYTAKGPKGDRGETGPRGENGTSITVKGAVSDKSKLPSNAAIGDTYVTSNDGHMWAKTSTSGSSQWTDLGEMKGPKGDAGNTGPAGPAGATGKTGPQGPAGPGITFGNGAPSTPSQPGAVYVDVADGFKVYQFRDNG